MRERKRLHLWQACWCGSGHDWEKAKHGTVDGKTQKQIEVDLQREKPSYQERMK